MASVIDFEVYRKTQKFKESWIIRPDDSELVATLRNLSRLIHLAEEQEAQNGEKSIRESVSARKCTMFVTFGELDGHAGFFTRFAANGTDILISFTKKYNKGAVDRYVDHTCKPRMPWKRILAGESFEAEVVLADYTLERINEGYGSGSSRIVHYNFSSLPSWAFTVPE